MAEFLAEIISMAIGLLLLVALILFTRRFWQQSDRDAEDPCAGCPARRGCGKSGCSGCPSEVEEKQAEE